MKFFAADRPDEESYGISYENIDDFLEGKEVGEEVLLTIRRFFMAARHKRMLPRRSAALSRSTRVFISRHGMRVHHLNCISSCPLGGKLFDSRTPSLLRRGELTCHCLLVESEEGLVLIDTGFGLRDVADPRSRLSAFFLLTLKPEFREEMTAIRQIERRATPSSRLASRCAGRAAGC